MKLLQPTPPPYDALEWEKLPLAERGRLVCQAWAVQGYGTPPATYVVYLLKVVFLIAMWSWFCGFSPGLGGLSRLGEWWLSPVAFQKAILWCMLFEGLGLGCGSGPLTGRYAPPVGGFLYFLRPGTTKLPLFRRLPLLGGDRRTALDVILYMALVAALTAALLAPVPSRALLLAIFALVPLLGLCDRTLFLAVRAEHYWVTVACFAFAPGDGWIAGAQAVQLALWFWAGVSKLNHHFPAVVCVMTSNSPVTRFAWIRKRMYRSYPDDLRPSRLATAMAHAGAALELGTPAMFVAAMATGEPRLFIAALIMMLTLHGFITSTVPMGVPIEWNVMVVYGGFALFWAHQDVTPLQLGSLLLAAGLAVSLIALPLAGNLWPRAISFLLAMRYYAGNWAYGVWLFRGDSYRKLGQLTTSAPWVYDQLAHFYDRRTAVGLVGKVMAFRMMHLHGRALPLLIPRVLEEGARLSDYEYMDGEIIAGLALGWNFGDGHLHCEPLLAAVQAQCGFAPGELRCLFVESQPLGGASLSYRLVDAARGELGRGELLVAELRQRQPWEVRSPDASQAAS